MRLLLAGAVPLCLLMAGAFGLTGCNREEPSFAAQQSAMTDDEFAAGANRAPTPQTMYATARILAAQGRDEQAASLLMRAIQKQPKFTPAYCDLAELHLRNGRTQQAMQVLTMGMKQTGDDARLVNNLGMCFILRRDPQAALRLFTRAAALKPNDGRYRANMAMALCLLGRCDESLALYQQVVSKTDAQYNVALLKARAGTDRQP